MSARALRGVRFQGRTIAESFADAAGAASHEARKESLRQLLRKGGRELAGLAGPVVVEVSPRGHLEVSSGRHRIEVLREPEFAGAKMLTRFVRGSDSPPASPKPRAQGGTTTARFTARGVELEARVVTTVHSPIVTETIVTVTSGDREVGRTVFQHRGQKLYPLEAKVALDFRRQGIASRMYAMAEEQTAKRVIASQMQTAAGRALSKSFRSRRK